MSGSAVVIGAASGIGAALEAALIDEGAHDRVYGFARGRTGADHIDILDEASIAAAAARVAAGPAPTLVLIATGVAPDPAGATKADLDRDALAQRFAVNAIGPALVARHFIPLLATTGTPVFGALSARAGSISDNLGGGSYGHRASMAALNMLIKTLAIESTRDKQRAIIVGIDPGTADAARAALQLLDLVEGLGVRDSGKCFNWDGAEIAP